MFDNRKIKRLDNKINSLAGSGSGGGAPVEASGDWFVAKITSSSFNSTDLVYDYIWVAVNDSGANNLDMGSGNARCIQERGVDMTGKSAKAPVGAIVYVFADGGGFHFAYGEGSLGLESPDVAFSGSWLRSNATTAVNFGVLGGLTVDYNQNQAYATVLTVHLDSQGGCFQIGTTQVPVFNLIAINQ